MEGLYQVISTCYSQGEWRVSSPEQVCARSVGEQEGHHLTGILEKQSFIFSQFDLGKVMMLFHITSNLQIKQIFHKLFFNDLLM